MARRSSHHTEIPRLGGKEGPSDAYFEGPFPRPGKAKPIRPGRIWLNHRDLRRIPL